MHYKMVISKKALKKENKKLKNAIKLLLSLMEPSLEKYEWDNKKEAYVFNDFTEEFLAYYEISKEDYDLLKELENE